MDATVFSGCHEASQNAVRKTRTTTYYEQSLPHITPHRSKLDRAPKIEGSYVLRTTVEMHKVLGDHPGRDVAPGCIDTDLLYETVRPPGEERRPEGYILPTAGGWHVNAEKDTRRLRKNNV